LRIDQPSTQAWKRQRQTELGFGIPEWLQLVAVNFEADDSWCERLVASGFDASKPAVVVSTGVSLYLTTEAITFTLRQMAGLAPGSTFAMTFLLPLELADPEVRPGLDMAAKAARTSGTPFIRFFTPAEMNSLGREAGFREVQHVSAITLARRYFAGRSDGLCLPATPRNSWSHPHSMSALHAAYIQRFPVILDHSARRRVVGEAVTRLFLVGEQRITPEPVIGPRVERIRWAPILRARSTQLNLHGFSEDQPWCSIAIFAGV
jgi:hypothetical protein